MKSRNRSRRKTVLSIETLESRQLLVVSVGWDGAGLGSAQLTYYVGKAPTSISQSAVEAAINTALKAWSSVAKIQFTKTTRIGQNNSLDFTFKNIDGAGGILGQAYFPKDVNSARIAGDVMFDSSEKWEVGNSKGSAAFDLALIAVHEVGHALGLGHSTKAGSVMAATVKATQRFVALATADITAIRGLYATKGASIPSTALEPNTPPNVNTHNRIDNIDAVPSKPNQEHKESIHNGREAISSASVTVHLAAANLPTLKPKHVDLVYSESIEQLMNMNHKLR